MKDRLRALAAGVCAATLTALVAAPVPASADSTASATPPTVAEGGEGVEADVVEVPVVEQLDDRGEASMDPLAEAGEPDAGGVLYSASGTPSGLAVVGVTWAAGTAPEGTAIVLRTRNGDAWSDWTSLATEEVASEAEIEQREHSTNLRDGTEPVFIGAVDEVQVAVNEVDGAYPEDVRLVVVDPGQEESSGASVANASWEKASPEPATGIVDESASVSTARSTDASVMTAASRPTIYSRAQWGADESIMTWTPQIGRVDGAVVHHTAGSNNYTAEQVPSVIRGIYTYHAKSRGWGDIGYNFLVDKYGRIWEGRAGGIERAIVGGHAVGVNSQTFGLSLMGNYDQASVPSAAMSAMSRLIAWKLSLHGVPAGGTAVIDGRNMPAVIGHRDVAQTACPGANLYPRLGELRSAAASQQGSLPFRTIDRDLDGDARPDLVVERDGSVSLLTAHGWRWGRPTVESSGWTSGTLVAAGDWNRDGRGDLLWRDGAGRLYLLARTASGWAPRQQIGQGWSGMNALVGGHDWSGDGVPDLLARRASDGTLWLYPNDGRGGFGSPRQVGWGWQNMSAITMIGTVRSGPALVARNGEGRLITYLGDGRGGFAGTISHGRGWDAMTSVLGVGDASGDGHADIVVRDRDGLMWKYLGDGRGSFTSRIQIGNGWQAFTSVVATRTGSTVEVYPLDRSGVLRRYTYSASDQFAHSVSTSVRVGAGSRVLAAGDWDGDGHQDLMVRTGDGKLLLHRGTGPGAYAATGLQVGHGWGIMRDIVAADDFAGDGRPALLALESSSGRIWLYPGDGRGGFGSRVLLATAPSADTIVSVGAWTGRVHDVVTRENGRLVLREGNGAARLGAPRQIGQGWGIAASIVGVGDATGDGRPDIVLVATDGTIRLYPGDGRGGFLHSVPYGAVPTGGRAS